MSDVGQSQKKCSVEKGNNQEDTPMECVIDAPSEKDKKRDRGKSKRRGSKKNHSPADARSSAKGNTRKGRGNSKQSRGKDKKRQILARNTGVKTRKDETDSEKKGNAKTKKTYKDKGKETSQNRGKSAAEETGEYSGTSESEDQKEYEVERIVDIRQSKEGEREFLIKWRGYPNKFNSWESENNMNCSEKIEKFFKSMEQNSTKRKLRVVRKKPSRFIADDGGRERKMSLRLGKMPRKSYSELD